MNSLHPIRWLSLCFATVLASCGGGGGDADPAAAPPPPAAAPTPAAPFAGTAYLRTEIVSRLSGRDYGLSGGNARAAIEQCNALRTIYSLPPSPAIDPAVMTSLDVQTREQYFDNGVRAATYVAGRVLLLPDVQRWLSDTNRYPAGTPLQGQPLTPPDCAAYQLGAIDNGQLWRDGLRYDIDFKDRTARAQTRAADFTAQTVVDAAEVARWPGELIAGQSCKVAAVEGPLGSVGSCIWERFPLQKLLNWPWVLRSESTVGSGAGAITQTTTTLELTSNRALAENRLRVPDGFTVTGP